MDELEANREFTNMLEKTMNGKGFMHGYTPITKAWLHFSREKHLPLLDIGAAYGIATNKALENNTVIANDICLEHLEQLKVRAPQKYLNNLIINHSKFPEDTNFESGSISSVLCSHVLQFLDGEQVIMGFKKIYDWLEKGGQVFILTYTPYHATLKNFIPIYEERKGCGDVWPGLIEDKYIYNDSSLLSRNLPKRIHLFDPDILTKQLSAIGFKIIRADILGGEENGVPEPFVLDGKEFVAVIAER